MTNIIFSGIDKAFFNSLTFNSNIKVSWLSIDELMNAGSEVVSNDAKFVMLYNSPEAFLSALGHEAINNLAQAEQQWLPQTEMLTQLYLAHKDHAILVNSEQCEDNFDEFISLLNTKFNIDSEPSTINTDVQLNNEGARLLIKSLQLTLVIALSDNYDIQSTYENVMGASDLLVANNDYSPEERTCIHRDECEELVTQIILHRSDYIGLVKENESALSKNQALKADLKTIYKEQKTSQKQLTRNKKSAKKVAEELILLRKSNVRLGEDELKLKSEIKELSTENELSLLQMHQLQEELESVFNQNQAVETQLADNNFLQEVLDENTVNLRSNNEQISDLKAENEIALLQIQQLQEELEFYFIKYQSLNAVSIINDILPAIVVDKRFEKSLTLARMLNA
jgi:hypothetical protein